MNNDNLKNCFYLTNNYIEVIPCNTQNNYIQYTKLQDIVQKLETYVGTLLQLSDIIDDVNKNKKATYTSLFLAHSYLDFFVFRSELFTNYFIIYLLENNKINKIYFSNEMKCKINNIGIKINSDYYPIIKTLIEYFNNCYNYKNTSCILKDLLDIKERQYHLIIDNLKLDINQEKETALFIQNNIVKGVK